MAQVPPKTEGKRESKTLCPVRRGTFPASFSAQGLTCLTGQYWLIWIFYFLPSNSNSAMVSSIVALHSCERYTSFPFIRGGTKILCSSNNEFSKQDPKISPPVNIYPILMFLLGWNNHCFSILRAGTSALKLYKVR